jgi:hypothetical protein
MASENFRRGLDLLCYIGVDDNDQRFHHGISVHVIQAAEVVVLRNWVKYARGCMSGGNLCLAARSAFMFP